MILEGGFSAMAERSWILLRLVRSFQLRSALISADIILDLFDGRYHETSSCIDVVACVCCIGCFDGFHVGFMQRDDLAPRCSIESISRA